VWQFLLSMNSRINIWIRFKLNTMWWTMLGQVCSLKKTHPSQFTQHQNTPQPTWRWTDESCWEL
jgi:hypothetical protein